MSQHFNRFFCNFLFFYYACCATGAIRHRLRYCPTGQYAQFGARLLPKRAIRRAWRGYCLQQYAALCAYCATGAIRHRLRYRPTGQYAQFGARLLPKRQYAVLGAAITCSNTPLFAPIAPAGAIGLGLRYRPTGQYAQLGARLLPKRAIRRASVLLARAILGLRIV